MAVQIDFKPEARERIARSMGYTGSMGKFNEFLASDPSKQVLMERYKMYAGGMVLKAQQGTDVMSEEQRRALQMAQGVGQAAIDRQETGQTNQPVYQMDATQAIENFYKAFPQYRPASTPTPTPTPTPNLPVGDKTNLQTFDTEVDLTDGIKKTTESLAEGKVPTVTPSLLSEQADPEQLIDKSTGQVSSTDPTAVAKTGTATTTTVPDATSAAAQAKTIDITDDLNKVETGIKNLLDDINKGDLTLSEEAKVKAEQQLTSAVSGLNAIKGEAQKIQDAPTRTITAGEMVDETPVVDQTRVGQAFGTGEVQAASIKDELTTLMQDFEGGATPSWAAGAMRKATALMSARGLGASSMAGQAIVQAAMEASLPIAQIEAGNKQQMALVKAEQRAKFMQIEFDQAFQARVINAAKVENIANMQFSADQQIALENSRLVNTMNLQNLSNAQSLVLAEASALANLDMANLNNRQQAQVMNAQNFLQIDMTKFSSDQQIELFKAQTRANALLSDQSAENAALQFNAQSENQVNQFFESLKTQVNQFNSAQKNAMEQFNRGQENAISQFNTQIENQRDQFNAQNELVVAQSNAQWRRQIATADNAAINRANEINVQNMLGLQTQMLSFLWQEYADENARVHETQENAADAANRLELQKFINEGQKEIASDQANSSFLGDIAQAAGYILS
tara:strand:- start:2326 stop:4371 length:2046 start_codon:yes stop_codon:yes gene_type:complete